MPRYHYACLDCQAKAIAENPDKIHHPRGEPELYLDLYESLVLFETSHSMNPTEEELAEAVICPRCQSTNCEKTLHGYQVHSYTLGYGYCDKAGAKRDMDIYTLKNDDPYKEHRVEGEVEEIENRIRKSVQPKPKHFVTSSSDEKNK